MHAEDGNTAVDDVHAVGCRDVRDRSSAAEIDFAKFSRLEIYRIIIHHFTEFSHVFSARIVGTGFSSGAGIFAEYDAASEVRTVFLFKCCCKGRIIGRIYIGRKHVGVCQASADSQF